jgi:hypothetical protein
VFKIVADIKKNRLYCTLGGFFGTKEMKECSDKTIEECKKLKPGFDVISDISDFKAVGQNALDEVKRAQAFFKQHGVRRAIRVEGKAKLTSIQFTRVGKEVEFTPQTVATLAEAEKILDSQK